MASIGNIFGKVIFIDGFAFIFENGTPARTVLFDDFIVQFRGVHCTYGMNFFND